MRRGPQLRKREGEKKERERGEEKRTDAPRGSQGACPLVGV